MASIKYECFVEVEEFVLLGFVAWVLETIVRKGSTTWSRRDLSKVA